MSKKQIIKLINPRKELFKWGPIEFRMIYGGGFMEFILVHMVKSGYYPWPWPPSLCIFENGRMTWINESLAVCQTGLKYFKKYFLNPKNYKEHWQRWEKWIEEYEKTARIFNSLNFKKLTNQELYRYLKLLYDLNGKFWLIVHVPEIANWGGEYFLKSILKAKFGQKAEEHLEVLSAPVKFSFFQQEELDLLEIGFVKEKTKRQKLLAAHSKNYCWLLNSYGGNQVLSKNYFEKKLKTLIQKKSPRAKISEIKNIIKKNQARKRKLIKKLKLNKKTILIADRLVQSIWWQDLRKGYIWRMNYFSDKFLKEISRRTDWKFEELLWCWMYEALDILKGKKISKREVLKRSKYYAFFGYKGVDTKINKQDLVKELANLYLNLNIKDVDELKGLAVSKGDGRIVRGRIKIISNPFIDGNKMKKGDILVAAMTSPDFIVVMRKAKAIITDHGSMVSHAAIVSRELKIPCIVGTKIATKILRDGQLVEVDANKGVVRIIKK